MSYLYTYGLVNHNLILEVASLSSVHNIARIFQQSMLMTQIVKELHVEAQTSNDERIVRAALALKFYVVKLVLSSRRGPFGAPRLFD